MNQSDDFVVHIHSVLAVRYGSRWAKQWAGIDMEFVRADWRRVLREYSANPAAVAHALDNLPPSMPPTVSEFLQLCAAAPRPAVRMLPRSGVKPAAQYLAVMERARAGSTANRREVALGGWQRIMQRVAAGEPVTPTIRRWAEGQAKAMGVGV